MLDVDFYTNSSFHIFDRDIAEMENFFLTFLFTLAVKDVTENQGS